MRQEGVGHLVAFLAISGEACAKSNVIWTASSDGTPHSLLDFDQGPDRREIFWIAQFKTLYQTSIRRHHGFSVGTRQLTGPLDSVNLG